MRAGVFMALTAAIVLGCNDSAPTLPPVAAFKAPVRQQLRAAVGAPRPAAATVVRPTAFEKPVPGEAPDISYLPDDAYAAVVFNARRAFQSQALAALPYEEIFAGSLDAWNFDPREVEHWFLFFTPAVEGEPLGTPYSPGAVMRFIKPVDGRKLISTRGEFQEAELGAKKYYVQSGEQPIAFFIADDRTIVFAARKQLEKMLSPMQSENLLARRLIELDRECDLQLLVNVEPLTLALDAVAEAAGQQLSGAVVPYVNALRDVSMITLTGDLSGERLLTATIEARDPDAAARLQRLAKESRPLVQAGYSMFRGAIVQAWRGDASQAVLDVTDSMMARAAVEYGERSLRLDVPKPRSLDDLGRRLRRALSP
ncbi:MAG: hypothetical protein WD894_04860 [Pirellulales bacterium]